LKGDATSTAYTEFQKKVSINLENVYIKENDVTSETVVEEHIYKEFITNFWNYQNSHYDKYKNTNHDYNQSNMEFFKILTSK
jgi:hypothetical protein